MYHTLTKEEIYTALDERHSPETQKLLSAGNVAIAGLGGLGSNVAYALARIGVGHLHLIDFDVVDITNLNRQQYFMEHIGMYKTDALKSLLLKINPYLDIRTDCVKVTDDNLQELFADATIVCEAFDNPEAKAMLVNGILESPPLLPGCFQMIPELFSPHLPAILHGYTDRSEVLYFHLTLPVHPMARSAGIFSAWQ